MRLALMMMAGVLAQCAANAQSYPTLHIQVIVDLSPGGSMEVTARLVSEKLKDVLGQQIIVENRPGANSILDWCHP